MRFSRAEFEKALPSHKSTGRHLWLPLGVIADEFTYLLPVTAHAGVLVRSSVRPAADQDSDIRLLVVRTRDRAVWVEEPVARRAGWQEHMTARLRALWRVARLTGPCGPPCTGWVGLHRDALGYFPRCTVCGESR